MAIFKHKTIGLRGVIIILSIVAVGAGSAYAFYRSNRHAAIAYPSACVSQACREAADRASAADVAAQEASKNAQTLEGEVARLNSEIAALESAIAMNQAIANDLSVQIGLNEEKLSLQQSALATLLVDIHFEQEPDAIILLASSNSIGDLAEKQARQDSAKNQVTSSAIAVKTLKEELESQKASVDALIEADELSRNEIAAKRSRQESLIEKYKNDTAAYERDALAAREIMQKEIAAEIARYNSGGVVGEGYNSYPYQDRCPQDDIQYIVVGGYVCQCTSYAGWKAQEFYGIYISSWGNARDWGSTATRLGYVVDDNPAPHTIGYSTSGAYGHVVWIESINSNGTVNLTEYNNASSSKSGLSGDFGARYNVNASSYRYIHLDQKRW